MYSTSEDIRGLVNQDKLKTILGIEDAGDIEDSKLQPFIDNADAIIETKLGAWYILPITGANALRILKALSIELAIGRMYELNADGELPEKVKNGKAWALKELDAYGGSEFVSKPVKWLTDAKRTTILYVKNLGTGEEVAA